MDVLCSHPFSGLILSPGENLTCILQQPGSPLIHYYNYRKFNPVHVKCFNQKYLCEFLK